MDEEGMSLDELFNILLRRLHWIILVFISVLIIGIGYLFLTNTELYKASATYTIESIESLQTTPNNFLATNDVNEKNLEKTKDFSNELQYLQNENTFRLALESLNLSSYGTESGKDSPQAAPVTKNLMERIEITNPKNTNFVDITFSAYNQKFAIDFINALSIAYNNQIGDLVRNKVEKDLSSARIQRDSYLHEYNSIIELSVTENTDKNNVPENTSVDSEVIKFELQKSISALNSTIAQYEQLIASPIEGLTSVRLPTVSEGTYSSNNSMLILAVAVLLGLALGVLAALFIDMMIPVIDHPDILYRTLGVETKLITTIPLWNKKVNHDFPELVTYGKGIEDLREQYNLIGGRLLFTGTTQSHRCFSFASQGLMEGSSFTVANLGVALAHSGKEVLLIDASASANSLSDIFNIQTSDTGLSDIVLRDQNWKNCVKEPLTNLTNLKVLPIGNGTNNRSAVVHNPRFKSVINELTEQFDIVLVDTPPFIYPSDMLAVSETTEGVVLIVRSGLANRKRIKEVTSMLQSTQVSLLGIVMNGHYDAMVGFLSARQNFKHRIASSSMYKTLIRKASSRVN